MIADKTILVTGGAGFIGSALIKQLLREADSRVVNIDKLTYAGNLESLSSISNSTRYSFEHADICDAKAMVTFFRKYQPDAIIHLAAETHVDRSIDGPAEFISTNVVGTLTLLEVARDYLRTVSQSKRELFRFHHVSTDEVFGSLEPGQYFTETSPYRPNSPYAASKAAADHLVRAWHKTYGLPVLITNCGNNYGPYQYPEKLIPLMITRALDGKQLPVYGDGQNMRDWIYVEDHCAALRKVLSSGEVGQTYLVGANTCLTNLQLLERLCACLDERCPRSNGKSYRDLITFVDDRAGHDRRYALNTNKIEHHLKWQASESIDTGLQKTVSWYVENRDWCRRITEGFYRGERLGRGS